MSVWPRTAAVCRGLSPVFSDLCAASSIAGFDSSRAATRPISPASMALYIDQTVGIPTINDLAKAAARSGLSPPIVTLFDSFDWIFGAQTTLSSTTTASERPTRAPMGEKPCTPSSSNSISTVA